MYQALSEILRSISHTLLLIFEELEIEAGNPSVITFHMFSAISMDYLIFA